MAPLKARCGGVSLDSSVVRDRPACVECVDIKLVKYNAFHFNLFYVIMHAVDGGSLQYFSIQCQSTEINIISWLISQLSFNVKYTFT